MGVEVEGSKVIVGGDNISPTVSLSLHHSHPCIIYEVNMRHIQDKNDAIMKQISIFFSKYEVLRTAILNTAKTL